ncbi:MAG TPA: hypothetical protein VH765_09820 [Xanthobacteraceae bacterium]|jgi:hypothetical protein
MARSACVYALAAAIAGFGGSPAWAQAPEWHLFYNQEARYSSWQGTRGYPAVFSAARGSGTQFYTPATVGISAALPDVYKFEFVARGGYVVSNQSSPGLSGSVSTFTDTVAAATWSYLGIPGVQPFVSISANLPSGTSALHGTDTFARMDPDLVDVPTFGEGWNIGPTAGISFAIAANVVLSVGVGHTFRGDYQREIAPGLPTFVDVTVDPGDVTTGNMSLGMRKGKWVGQLSGSYSHEGTTSIAGTPAFRLGDRYLVTGYSSYAWTDNSISSLIGSWGYTLKNTSLIPPLLPEAFNSNSNLYRVRFEHAFIAGNWSAGPVVSWLNRDKNAWAPATVLFIPAKTRWSAGGNVKYKVNDQTLVYANVEHIWIDEAARLSATPTPVPNSSYTGWAVSGGASFRY